MHKDGGAGHCSGATAGFCPRPEFEYENDALFRTRESVEDR